MVQQQFIISELVNDSEHSSDHGSSAADRQLESSHDEMSDHSDEFEKETKRRADLPHDREIPVSRGLYSNKVSFAIFGSFRHQFVLEQPKLCRRF